MPPVTPAISWTVSMSDNVTKPRVKVVPKTKRPPLHKVILFNDDYTPREFVVLVLKTVFRMNETQAYGVMLTAHRKGSCVIAVYARDIAETKAAEATDLGRSKGYPLSFTTEPEEEGARPSLWRAPLAFLRAALLL
jgi:ATP-dependent Clp protease adaptor protein ClpS